MSIRKQLQYDQHAKRVSGYVDLGAGPEDDAAEASEALVFMVTGLRSSWKAPVAFYFTKGLKAETQTELVRHCLQTLDDVGLQVHCLTMDGHATNLGMAALLGAQLQVENCKPFITLPDSERKVYILLDTCHMVKLLRNMLQALGTIKSPTGLIQWQLIKDLHNDQQELGLRLANKLTARHINFQQNKMKVALATQTLSNSVAVALSSMKEMGLWKYQQCDATVEFIQRVDRLFDILNSRSAFGKGYKQPLRLSNMEYITPFLNETRDYLASLTTVDNVPLVSTKRHVGITGFITSIDVVFGLVDQLLEPGIMKYILMYKCSQDHLELFFSAVRQCGGWNNNPTTMQFRAAFRRLITRCGALPASNTANAVPVDDTELLQASSSTYIPPTFSICMLFYHLYAVLQTVLGECHILFRSKPVTVQKYYTYSAS